MNCFLYYCHRRTLRRTLFPCFFSIFAYRKQFFCLLCQIPEAFACMPLLHITPNQRRYLHRFVSDRISCTKIWYLCIWIYSSRKPFQADARMFSGITIPISYDRQCRQSGFHSTHQNVRLYPKSLCRLPYLVYDRKLCRPWRTGMSALLQTHDWRLPGTIPLKVPLNAKRQTVTGTAVRRYFGDCACLRVWLSELLLQTI